MLPVRQVGAIEPQKFRKGRSGWRHHARHELAASEDA